MNTGNLNEGSSGYQIQSNASDPDLNAINGSALPKDAAVLEFDFITTGTSITFNYVFASCEYNEWVGSNYNDAFGFFISGPGINGPFTNNAVNMAAINSEPVSINTVNDNSNSNLFVFNQCCTPGQQNVNNPSTWVFVFDGQTVILSNTLEVMCNVTYHAKMAICNTADHFKQSAVFVQGGTLTSAYGAPGPLTIAPSPVCAGEEITLTVQGDPAWTYTWSTGQSGVGLQSVTTTASLGQDTYSVTAEYLPGCSLATASPAAMLTVHNPDNSPPQCLGVNGTGTYAITMQVGEQTCFTIPTSDAANEFVLLAPIGSTLGGSFSSNNAQQQTGTFCWTPGIADVGFHNLNVLLTDNSTCEALDETCSVSIKVVCDFCPVRVYYENRAPDYYPLPALTVAGESITAGYSVDPNQQDGNVITGNDPVEFRAPSIELHPGFFAGPGFVAVPDPDTCIEDCDVCCDGWNGFTVDTYDEGTENVLSNVFTPNGDGVNDRWEVLDLDHPYCAYGAMAFDLHIFNQWGSTVWRLTETWSQGCCPFRSWAPNDPVVSSIYWDGTANAGVIYCHGCHVSNSVYYYELTLNGCAGQITYTGYIHVFGSPAGMMLAPPPPAQEELWPLADTLPTDTAATLAVTEQWQAPPPALHVLPNPATDHVWLEYAPGLAHVWLLDATGRRVLELAPQGAPTTILQLEGLAPASYFLVAVDTEGQIHNRKLIKQ